MVILLNIFLIYFINHTDSYLLSAGIECLWQSRKNDLILALGYQVIVMLTVCITAELDPSEQSMKKKTFTRSL